MAAASRLCDYCSHIDFQLLHPKSRHDFDRRLSDPQSVSRYEKSGGWSLGPHGRITSSAASCDFCHAICELLQQNPYIHDTCKSRNQSLDELVCIVAIWDAGRIYSPNARPSKSWRTQGKTQDWEAFGLHRISLFWDEETSENRGPGAFKKQQDGSDSGLSLLDCFSACTPGTALGSTAQTYTLLEHTDMRKEDLVFAGRSRPPIINMELPTLWLKECLENHEKCRSRPSGNVPDQQYSTYSTHFDVFGANGRVLTAF